MDDPKTLADMREPSPWLPEQDRIRLAALGKLIEELNECSAIASRCIIQGLDEREPETGAVNAEVLTKEIADVMATCSVAVNALGLNVLYIGQRQGWKTQHLRRWHELIKIAESSDVPQAT